MTIGKGLAIAVAFVCATVAVVTGHNTFAYLMGFGGLVVGCL